jgi:ABC-type nitrate/sulfonate/bicarbonate transport system substrate-binding protein
LTHPQLIKELFERLKQQQEYINNKIEERDKLLMQSINEIIKNKQQSTAKKEKKGFLAKLFNYL